MHLQPTKRGSWLAIGLLVALLGWTPPPAAAMSSGDTLVVTTVPIATVVVVGGAGYLLYKNRLSQPATARGQLGYRGPGEFFVGAFAGASFIPDSDWTYEIGGQNYRARNLSLDPGATGGIKLGYFLDSLPYFGLEAEGSVGYQKQPAQNVALDQPLGGSTVGRVPGQTFLVWTMALHLVGRYGFYADKEVPFGRLQPYLGLGPGLVVIYGEDDSAKNFSLEVEAGLRYMFTKNLGGFLEYKFSKQWSVELEVQGLSGFLARKAVFDFDRHQVVVGLTYHF